MLHTARALQDSRTQMAQNHLKPPASPTLSQSSRIVHHAKAASAQGLCFSLFLSAADEGYGQESCSIDPGGLDKFAALVKKILNWYTCCAVYSS
jgi:hypothetical protein